MMTGALALAAIAALIGGCNLAEGLPPVVSYTTPADGSGNAPVASTISAAFSRPMDSTSITPGSFLVQMGDTPVAGTVTYSGKTAIFTPASLLPGNSLLTATITTAVKDVTGVALASPMIWTFMTTPTQTAGNMVLYYTYTIVSPNFTRSSSPGSYPNGGNTVSQSFNPVDGSVTLTITNAPAYQDNGFYFYVGSLQNFNTLKVVAAPGSGPFSANLYLDANGDGQFFSWVANVYSGLGGDLYYTGPSAVAGVLTIDAADPTCKFGGFTIPQLRAGSVAGVSGSTGVAIWLGFSLGAGQSQTTTISTVKVN